MIKIRTDKGRTTVTVDNAHIAVGDGKYGLSEAIEFISTHFFMAVLRGERVYTKLPENAITSLTPKVYPEKHITFTESEEEHISDRYIYATA